MKPDAVVEKARMGISWSRTLRVMAHRGKFGYMDRPAQHIKSNYCSLWSCLEIWKDYFGADLKTFNLFLTHIQCKPMTSFHQSDEAIIGVLPRRLCNAKSKTALEFYSKTDSLPSCGSVYGNNIEPSQKWGNYCRMMTCALFQVYFRLRISPGFV